MTIGKNLKISLIVSFSLLILLFFSMLLHNIRTLLSGQEEKIFYFLFVILFFVSPVFWLYTFLVLLITGISRQRNRQARKRGSNGLNAGPRENTEDLTGAGDID